MKSTNKTTAAFLLKAVLDVIWFISIAVAAIVFIIYTYAIINPSAEIEDASIDVPCNIEALDVNVPDFLLKMNDAERKNVEDRLEDLVVSVDPDNYSSGVQHTTTILRFRTHSRMNLAIYLFISVIWIILLLFIIYNLRKIMATLKLKGPFIPENVVRLRAIGVAACLSQPLMLLFKEILNFVVVKENFLLLGKPVSVDLWNESNDAAILFGLFVLAISEVFRIGVKMKNDFDELQLDQKLTV